MLAQDNRARSMFSAIGYSEIVVQPFCRHGYYNPVPVVRDVHRRFSDIARRHDWRTIASFAYIAVRK
jgi:hypothetical protein